MLETAPQMETKMILQNTEINPYGFCIWCHLLQIWRNKTKSRDDPHMIRTSQITMIDFQLVAWIYSTNEEKSEKKSKQSTHIKYLNHTEFHANARSRNSWNRDSIFSLKAKQLLSKDFSFFLYKFNCTITVPSLALPMIINKNQCWRIQNIMILTNCMQA